MSFLSFSQDTFKYEVQLTPVAISDLPGLHSYAFGVSDSLWVFIGGRRDGLHARQPFNAFPEAYNNDSIYVVDHNNQTVWSKSVDGLPISISEQLQSSNMNFFQDADTLVLIGGYAFSASQMDHITFPSLITVNVHDLCDSIIHGNEITALFKQVINENFAVTGGQLGKIDDTYLLIGGHRFDGTYNPMNNPTFVQTYTNSVRKFKLNNSMSVPMVSDYYEIIDPENLHRRDYNLMPYLFSNGDVGYLISSGVFQTGVNLPFLYPVILDLNTVTAVPGFQQKLSNYHSAKVAMHDSLTEQYTMIYFGGMASYYYDGNELIYDSNVPFVKTISLVVEANDGSFHEYKISAEMPELVGSSAEFIPNADLQISGNDMLFLPQNPQDTIFIGHIFGGIHSPALNPFTNNQTGVTSAVSNLYRVELIYNPNLELIEVPTFPSSEIKIYPNPVKNKFYVTYDLMDYKNTSYAIATPNGEIAQEGEMLNQVEGENTAEIKLDRSLSTGIYIFSLIFDEKVVVSTKLIVE